MTDTQQIQHDQGLIVALQAELALSELQLREALEFRFNLIQGLNAAEQVVREMRPALDFAQDRIRRAIEAVERQDHTSLDPSGCVRCIVLETLRGES